MSVLLLALLGFALGSLPFGLWIGKAARGLDVRDHGSGNLGATNVLRTLGPGWGLLTLALDIAKGWAAVAVAPGWLGMDAVGTGSLGPLVGAVAAVLGHMVTPLAGFHGGKGVATSLGAFLALSPVAALLGMAGFILTVTWRRYVSMASMIMAIVFPLAATFWGPPRPLRLGVIAVGCLLAGLVAWRHRANWKRIAAGTEPRFRWRSE